MIVAFLDCHMVMKSKSLLSTPAVQPGVDPQGLGLSASPCHMGEI